MVVRHVFLTVLLLSEFILGKPVSAQDDITILFSEIDYLFGRASEKQGPYNKIADALFHEPDIKTLFVPPSRSDLMWQEKEARCLFPANVNTMQKDSPLLSSIPINTVRAYIFSLQPYTSKEDFESKTIALRRGTSYGGIRSQLKADFIDLNSDQQGIQILEKNRVDGLIAYFSDAIGAYESLDIDVHYYNPSLPVYVATEHLVCFDNPKNRILIEQTNHRIRALQQSGKLAKWILNSKYTR